MEGAALVLVIILSVVLAIFLVLAIVLVVLLIKVTKQIKAVTSTAQKTAEGIDATVRNLSVASSPFAIAKIIKNVISLNKTKK